MKNNKTCHLTYILLFVLSFFLFSFNVNADTYNVSIPDTDFTYVNDTSDFNSFKQLLLDKIDNSDFNYYVIFYKESYDSNDNIYFDTSTNNLYARLYTSLPTISIRYYTQRFNIWFSGSGTEFMFRKNPDRIIQSSSFPNLYININYNNNYYSSLGYLDSNLDLTYTGTDIIDINSSHYSYTLESGENIYSLYYLYSHTSSPPDNTPILTDFYSLVIDKFSIIANFFTDNTYLFALPLIPIIILCIYLIKRSLIK